MLYPPVISALYNDSDQGGALLPWTVATATEIAMRLLRIMEEPACEVRLPCVYPPCWWAYEPACDALDELAKACGCVVERRGDGVLVVREP